MTNQRIIVTIPPVNEPITVAEARAYLRIPSGTISDQIDPAQTIPPASYGVATVTGAAVDLAGVASTLVLLEAGTVAGTVAVRLQHSDVSDPTPAWPDVASGVFTPVTGGPGGNDNRTYEKEYTGGQRYIRAVATVTGAPSNFGVSVIRSAPINTDDTSLADLITEAREWAEKLTGRALMLQTREAVFDAFPDSPCKINCVPILKVESFKYKSPAGVETTWANTNYILDADSVPPRLSLAYGISWPSVTLYPVSAIRVAFTCGYSANADAAVQRAAVPQPIRKTMLRRIQWLYDHRSVAAAVLQSRSSDIVVPEAIEKALAQELGPYRLWRFQ